MKRVEALLEEAGADASFRRSFTGGEGGLFLYPGTWQSWSPGWELREGEAFPSRVRLIPELYALSAAPWELTRLHSAPSRWAGGSGLMYLRRGEQYLLLCDNAFLYPPAGPCAPLEFQSSPDRKMIRCSDWSRAEIFCVSGYFEFRDTLKRIFRQEEVFARNFVGDGEKIGAYGSWYNRYTNISEETLSFDLDCLCGADNIIKLMFLDRGKAAVFQIDDGWEKAVGDWEIDKSAFRRGFAPLLERINAAGLVPGIWLAPFLATKKSDLFRSKNSWLLRGKNGEPLRAGWNPLWDGYYYCLDLSRDDVLEYLDALMEKVVMDWGFRYIKLDFLYAGYLAAAAGSDIARTAAACDRAFALLSARKQDRAGNPVRYLGCGVPLLPGCRHFPLSRIGPDTRESWDWKAAALLNHLGRPSALLSLRNILGRAFMNGTILVNDGDVVFMRSKNCRLSTAEKELIATLNFALSDQIMISDADLSAKDLELSRRVADACLAMEGAEYGVEMTERDRYEIFGRGGRRHTLDFSGCGRRGNPRNWPWSLEGFRYGR